MSTNRPIGASDCDADGCDYPEPHQHGFACGPLCPCGQGMQANRTIGASDE